MKGMFYDASAFNGDISSWSTSAVTDISWMFWGASSFNPDDLSNWDTSSVTTMKGMFKCVLTDDNLFYSDDDFLYEDDDTLSSHGYGKSVFNGKISSWNTSAVTDMEDMFYGASSFNQQLLNWDTSAVTTMKSMFSGASAFNGNISSWITSSVTDMQGMFASASSFNQEGISNWDTSAVTDMSWMFSGASSFSQNLCAWKGNFPYSNSNDIFKDSGCTFKDDPSSETQGPFCASSCANG
jgi:surface protein